MQACVCVCVCEISFPKVSINQDGDERNESCVLNDLNKKKSWLLLKQMSCLSSGLERVCD